MTNATSALSLCAVLVGAAFAPATQAMNSEDLTETTKGQQQVVKINTLSELAEKLKPNDLWLINVGYGMIHTSTNVSERSTESSLFQKHNQFIESVKQSSETDYNNLTKKMKLGSGDEFVKAGEKGLPALLDKLSNEGVNIIPISSRGDDGKCGTHEELQVLSRTEKEFVKLGYNYTSWKKPVPLQNPTIKVHLQDNTPETHGTYGLRNGITYSTSGAAPHKSAAIIGLVNILKEEGHLPAAIYCSDRKKTIEEISADLDGVDLGIPLYLFEYTHPKAFLTPEDLKEFYIHRLPENFKNYETQFNEAFYTK